MSWGPMKDVPDELVRAALGKVGDAPVPGNTRDRWGQRLLLGGNAPNPRKKQFVATRVYDSPQIFAVMVRFSLDGVTFSASVPGGYAGDVAVQFFKGIDEQSTPGFEEFDLVAGQAQPFCSVIAKSLQIVASLGEPPDPIWVEIVVAITNTIDCADILGTAAGAPVGWTQQLRTVFPADGVLHTLAANKARRWFVVQNRATTDLEISFANGSAAGILLPGGISAIYEGNPALPYYGDLSLQHTAVDVAGTVTIVQTVQPFVAGLPDS